MLDYLRRPASLILLSIALLEARHLMHHQSLPILTLIDLSLSLSKPISAKRFERESLIEERVGKKGK